MHKEQLLQCHERIQPYIHNTVVLTSNLINEMAGTSLFFKCENFQRMGAYKIRGATNAIMMLSEEQRNKGVITHSSGNFAQAISLAARSLNTKAFIVMPENAPQVKRNAVEDYGGKIYECDSKIESRESTTRQVIEETGATFIHPSNDINVIYGQGTSCLELLEKHPDLEIIVVPIGGGGLIAGAALAANYFGDNCKVMGAEPFEVDDAFRSLISGKIETNQTTDSIADGLLTHLGDINFPIIQKHVDQIIRVTENEILEAMRLIWERMKIIIEPSSAVAFAAVLNNKKPLFK